MEPDGPIPLIGDNIGSQLTVANPGAECKKRHVNIAWHYVRECRAAGILTVMKINSNGSMHTKSGLKPTNWALINGIVELIIYRIFQYILNFMRQNIYPFSPLTPELSRSVITHHRRPEHPQQ